MRTHIAFALLATTLAGSVVSEAQDHQDGGHGAPHPPAADSHTASAVPGMADVELPDSRRQLTGVRTVTIGHESLTRQIRTVGVVAEDERRVRHVHTRTSGWVKQLHVGFVGARVQAGDPIISIYSPDLVSAEREYLLARSSGSRALLDAARTRLRLWDLTGDQIAELERSGRPREVIALHSPIGGVVTMKPVTEGMYVTPEMDLYTVTDLSQVWMWADVYEDEASLVATGQHATLTLAAEPTSRRTAVVSYVSPTLETSTRTLRVRLDIDNPDGALKPGMYATVLLDSPIGDVLALPEDAVIDTGERRIVFVQVGNGHYQPREVTLGRRAGGRYEVSSGLAAGDRVVVSAQFLLDSESRLRAATGGAPAHGAH
jgi:Cu(I)/Ag(I) efflux system membrane fusion protein